MAAIARMCLAALLLACAPTGPLEAASGPQVPIEVELIGGWGPCDLTGPEFSKGFRDQLDGSVIEVTSAASGIRSIPNPFQRASGGDADPIHVRVRVGSDASMTACFGGPGLDQGWSAEHWLVDVAIRHRGFRLSLPLSRRSSLWAPLDRETDCERIGRTVGGLVLEALAKESGAIRAHEQVSLDVAVHRDERYTGNSGGPGHELVHAFVATIPMAVTWSLMLSIVFLLLRTWRGLRHRHDLAE